MQVHKTEIPGLLVIEPVRFGDARGFFAESWSRRRMEEAGIEIDFVQDNHSLSLQVGTLRGLHFQKPPHAQAKLVRCGRGALYDVAVDIRHGSPTYGKWMGATLTAENGLQLLIPEGFLHGFVTRQSETEIVYKCSDYYAPDCDAGVHCDDPDLDIDWGLTTAPILSDKDSKAPLLRDLPHYFHWKG